MVGKTRTPADPNLLTLAGELRICLGKLVRRVREQSNPGDYSSSQKSVLLRLERDGPATVSALARAESVKPQSMRITVAALEATGAIHREADPSDGRQTLITLTETFRKIIKVSRAVKEDWLFQALQTQLTPQEREQLATSVKLLQRLGEF